MANPIYDMIGRKTPAAPNLLQQISQFAKTIQGNPEQMVKNLISSGRMSQEQFKQFSQMADQILPRKR